MSTALPPLSIQTLIHPFGDVYVDQRKQGYQGLPRHVRLPRVTPAGGGLIAKNEDGTRCAVTGKESLRIIRVSEPSQISTASKTEHKSATGDGGHRIDASRNLWDSSGLKMESASTGVAWGYGPFATKILTSARNGELIMWDLNKSGATKYERRTRESNRCINVLATTPHAPQYCITGAADGQLRVWDLRDMSKSLLRITHPSQISIRSVAFSPVTSLPLQVVVGHDNGTIYRWDLKLGQRGQLDKLPVAHSAPITSLDWIASNHIGSSVQQEGIDRNVGWLASGGLDRCVKVWSLSEHIEHKPTYTLRPSFPIRRIAWRPGYECELAVVSANDYSTHTLDVSANAAPVARVSSGLALDLNVRTGDANKDKFYFSQSPSGDAIEIWDVRRSWIAKWRVSDSASEGGATDIAFVDSHALWSQHASGSFGQLDLRNVSKPMDSIPRSAATWDATGSMTFIVDRPESHEVPFDDVNLDQQTLKRTSKALGDPSVKIATQAVGTHVNDFASGDVEVFKDLARRYIFEGRDRQEICVFNAGAAASAGHETAAQAWLLLGASLTQYIPPPGQIKHNLPKLKKISSPLQLLPSASSPKPLSAINGYSLPSSSSIRTSPSIEHFSINRRSPSRRSASVSVARLARQSAAAAASSSHPRLTPTSSTASSPRHLPIPIPLTPKYGSSFARRDSIDSTALSSAGSSLLLRRSSLPVTPRQNMSPSDRSTMRHVGEGVLEDSDSANSDFIGDREDEDGEDTAGNNSSEDGHPGEPQVNPAGVNLPRTFPTPSPLSRVLGHRSWTSDDTVKNKGESKESDADDSDNNDKYEGGAKHRSNEDESTPSPQSTDTASEGENPSIISHVRSSSKAQNFARRRWSFAQNKRRSRSSTVASLATQPRLLSHDSQSSVHTVSAAGSELPLRTDNVGRGDRESGLEYSATAAQRALNYSFPARTKSFTVSEHVEVGAAKTLSTASELAGSASSEAVQMTERRIEIIRMEDRRFKATTLAALKIALEEFADEGDVQTCAMFSLVASKELGISPARSTRFLDSYLELLSRLRLFTCAAYIRKYCEAEAICNPTLLGTTIYSTCGQCRKPLRQPAGISQGNLASKGGFSYCLTCRQACVTCSICRLPVRALLFQCSVCHHGGHQECYRQYYFQHAMVELPTSFPKRDGRGRTSTRYSQPTDDISNIFTSSSLSMSTESTSQTDASSTVSTLSSAADPLYSSESPTHNSLHKLTGHPCAAGCGHYCWAANMPGDGVDLSSR